MNHATNHASLSLLRKEKAGSCGPVITVTAEWSVHGFAGTEEEQCGGNSHPQRLTPNDDARIFTQVTKCHKKAHTHALPPALPLTHLAPNPWHPSAPRRRAATTPPHMPPPHRGAHSNYIQIYNGKSPTKGFCPHMATCHSMSHRHESPLTLPLVHTPPVTHAQQTTGTHQ